MEFDKINKEILDLLQADCRVALKEISDRLHYAPSTARERIVWMEKSGIIEGYTTIISPEAMGLKRRAIVYATAPYQNLEEVIDQLKKVNGVLQIYRIADVRDLMFVITAENDEAINQLIKNKIAPLGIDDIEVNIIMGSENDAYQVSIQCVEEQKASVKERRVGRPKIISTFKSAAEEEVI